MENRQAHIGKMEKELKQWGAKLDELVVKADEAGAEVKVDYHKHIDELKAKHADAKTKLDELKTAGNEKWAIFKAGFDSAWNELEVAFKKLKH